MKIKINNKEKDIKCPICDNEFIVEYAVIPENEMINTERFSRGSIVAVQEEKTEINLKCIVCNAKLQTESINHNIVILYSKQDEYVMNENCKNYGYDINVGKQKVKKLFEEYYINNKDYK